MLENHSETVGNERVMTLRRKLLHGALVLVLALTLLMAFTPGEASAFGSGSYGGGSGCSGCTIYNHNETLVEDED